jgi:hypothetical protein
MRPLKGNHSSEAIFDLEVIFCEAESVCHSQISSHSHCFREIDKVVVVPGEDGMSDYHLDGGNHLEVDTIPLHKRRVVGIVAVEAFQAEEEVIATLGDLTT